MKILRYGQSIQCRGIKFEDGRIDFEKYGHPGTVLLPTTDKDEVVYCLIRTTKSKGERNKQFIPYEGESDKKSYVNIYNIVEQKNYIREEYQDDMSDQAFARLLESFIKYQESLPEPNEKFKLIGEKVKTLLKILKINMKVGLFNDVDIEQVDALSAIRKKKSFQAVYIASLSLNLTRALQKNERYLYGKMDKEYFRNLVKLYRVVSDTDLSNIDLNDENNKLRQISLYIKEINFLNSISVMQDLCVLLSTKPDQKWKVDLIKRFIELEERRQAETINKIADKYQNARFENENEQLI